jgi:hypothetical protein
MPITSMMSECKPDIQDITAHVKNLMLDLSGLGLVHINKHYTIWSAAWIPDSTDDHNKKMETICSTLSISKDKVPSA